MMACSVPFPCIQNFSVAANSDQDLQFTIETCSPEEDSLSGDTDTLYWRAYEQMFGCPVEGLPPVIAKSSLSGGGIVVLPSPPMTFQVSLSHFDTINLLRNYYHEVLLVDASGNQDTIACGIMTVIQTENRL